MSQSDEMALQHVREAVSIFNSHQALRELEDDYQAITAFLGTIQTFMMGDASALAAQRLHTSFCADILVQSHQGGSQTFGESYSQTPKNQHDALMYLHRLTQKLNNYALETESKRSRLEAAHISAKPKPAAYDDAYASSTALAERREEAAKLLRLHPECERLSGQELREAVEHCRDEVNRWVSEKEELQAQIARTEAEVETLRGDGEIVVASGDLNDGARAMLFRNARMERMRVDAQIDTLRRILCLPLR
jgi:hypothetical protein